MHVGFGVSLNVRGEVVDPAMLLAMAEAVVRDQGIDVHRVGNVVRFSAVQRSALTGLAEPLVGWWQQHEPTVHGDVQLRFVGPGGVTELSYSRPDVAVEHVRRTIEAESGRFYGPGEAPGLLRRFAARVGRAVRTGFTATELRVDQDGPCLRVALAGRQLDDEPRQLELQAFDPTHDEYDPADDEGYCIVNESYIPVYLGLVGLQMTGKALHLTLTKQAAQDWRRKSTRMTVRLRLDQHDTDQLRTALQEVFTHTSSRWPSPRLDFTNR